MIEIEGLTKRFGPFAAVAGIDLKVGKGEVLGFLGPNGAGKSTTMKMVTGFLAPTAGRVRICGHDIETDAIAAQQRDRLSAGRRARLWRHDAAPVPRLHRARCAAFEGERRQARASHATVAKTELDPVLDQPIETLSKGFKRRVGLAQAILHDPPVLIMDEPTDGLDPNQKHSVRALIRAMAPEKAIIVSTHLLEEVEAICTRAVIIDRGRVVADGTPAELARPLAPSQCGDADAARGAGATAREAKLKIAEQRAPASSRSQAHDGTVELTAFPKSGALLIEDVSALAVRREMGRERALRRSRPARRSVPRHHHA